MFHRASTSSLCVKGSSSSDSEVSQGGAATATSLLDAPKLFELGIMNFSRHNDNNCEHNTIRSGEMRNRIMQHYWGIINASLVLGEWSRANKALGCASCFIDS